MKLPLALSFFVAVIQLCSSNILSKREILLSDATAVQNGSDVTMLRPGPLEVVLNNASELIFGVCEQKCFGEFLVCFEGAKNGSFSTKFCDSQCGFYVNVDDRDEITYFRNFSKHDNSRPKMNCTEMVMRDKETIQDGYYAFTYPSCLPKVENGIVQLNITTATDKCVVTVKNAKIKPEEIIATSAPNSPANNPPSDSSSTATKIIGNFGWIFALISFCILYA